MKKRVFVVAITMVIVISLLVTIYHVIDKRVGIPYYASTINQRYHLWMDKYGNYKPRNTTVSLSNTALPVIYIDANDQIRKDKKTPVNVKIADSKGCVDFEGQMLIKYRGHASFRVSEKKSYSLRPIDEMGNGTNISLLGSKKNKKWCLLAQHIDRSMIRELVSYEIARPYMKGVPQTRICELVFNGVYYGVYILSDQPSRKSLSLTKTSEAKGDVSGSYLLYWARANEADYVAVVNNKGIVCKYPFQVKYPDKDEMGIERKEWLDKRFSEMVAAISDTTSDRYKQYIDEQSFIDFQLVAEISHNPDAMLHSAYMYKDIDDIDSTFRMHVWDNDHSFGIGNVPGYGTYNNWIWEQKSKEGECSQWFDWLFHNPYYKKSLVGRYKEWREGICSTANLSIIIDSLANVLISSGAIDRNKQAWDLWKIETNHRIAPPPHAKFISDSFLDEIQYIKDWTEKRLAWMDEQLLEDNECI